MTPAFVFLSQLYEKQLLQHVELLIEKPDGSRRRMNLLSEHLGCSAPYELV
jgi:hypothetical protein